MEQVLAFLRGVSLPSVCLRLLCATIIGAMIGVERGRHGRVAGMRTHILVCVGAAMSMLCGIYMVSVLGIGQDATRLAAQTLSGVGFIGVGTILVRGKTQVTGLTTAAGLWVSATLGLAVGAGFYEAAAIAIVIIVVANNLLPKLERRYEWSNTFLVVYLEICGVERVQNAVDEIKLRFPVREVDVTAPRSGCGHHVGLMVVVYLRKTEKTEEQIVREMGQCVEAVFAIKSA